MPTEPKSLSLAVLIDADNTSPRYAKPLFEEIAGLGEANVRRIYGDFSGTRLGGWEGAIQSLAILQQQQRNNTTGKNAADIALVIDAIDLMHKGAVDGFCLVSSDSDFTRLAQRLREDGMYVFGFGERKTPEAFRAACNRFIYVENLVEPTASGPVATKSSAANAGATGSAAKEPATKAVPIILKAMTGIENDDGWAVLSQVGSQISKISPDFDQRTYGHDKLSALVEKGGAFEIQKHERQGLMIRPKNPKRRAPAQ